MSARLREPIRLNYRVSLQLIVCILVLHACALVLILATNAGLLIKVIAAGLLGLSVYQQYKFEKRLSGVVQLRITDEQCTLKLDNQELVVEIRNQVVTGFFVLLDLRVLWPDGQGRINLPILSDSVEPKEMRLLRSYLRCA